MIPDPPGLGIRGRQRKELKLVQSVILNLKEEFRHVHILLDFHPMPHLSPNKVGAQVPSQQCQEASLYLLVSDTSSALYSNASYSPVSGHCLPCWCPLLTLAASKAWWKLGEGSGTPWLTQPHVSWPCTLRVSAIFSTQLLAQRPILALWMFICSIPNFGPWTLWEHVGVSKSHPYHMGTGDSFRELPSSPVSTWPCCTTAVTLIGALSTPCCPGWQKGKLGDALLSKASK